MKLSLMAWALLASALAMSACGEDSAPTRATALADDVDTCALLTAEEIEAATGIAPGAPERADVPGGVPVCNWPTADDSDPAFLTLLLAPSHHYGNFDAAIAEWKQSATDMGFDFEPGDYEEVEGVGDFGAWLKGGGMLQAHRGGTMVQVAVRVAADRDMREAAVELARHALARLP